MMKQHFDIIAAIIRKDLRGLLPLVLLGAAVFLIQPLISSLDAVAAVGDAEFLAMVQTNSYWVSYFLACLLMVSVLQQDPADSLNHDWLARPVPRLDWLLAKLGFMALTIVVPVVLGRFLTYLSQDHGVMQSLAFAATVEKLYAAVLIPLLFAVGLLTSSLRRAIQLLAVVVFIFLMPAWSVTRPLLELMGIELGGELDGMLWLQGLPIVVASSLGAVAVFWLLYCRRLGRPAMLAFTASMVVVFFSTYPPLWLLDWDRAVAIHRGLLKSADDVLEQAIVMESVQACFPAAFVDTPNNTPAGTALLMAAAWQEPDLRQAGPGAVTLATTIQARGLPASWLPASAAHQDLPLDWRLARIRAQAILSADTLHQDVRLIRSYSADNRYAPIAPSRTEYWLVPGDVAARTADDPSTHLTLRYDLALLSPHARELAVDGQFHDLAALGSCKAQRDTQANTIEVECLKRGAQPPLMSAELIGLEASRVDSHYRANFTPGWLEAIGLRHTRLTLNNPALVDSTKILLTAYDVASVLSQEVVSPGLLGNTTSVCPLPGAETTLSETSSWRDRSPHEISSVTVEPGVRLEVLDWRSGAHAAAPTLLLLPGLGATAHSYDQLAAKLALDYDVVAMTRRGIGDSSKPDHGYEAARLAQDVLQVMEVLGIEKPILVGHSIGGEELSYLGANHSERFSGLIYLDAAYDRAQDIALDARKRLRALNAVLPPRPPIHPAEARSYEALKGYMRRVSGNDWLPPEGEILASYDLDTGATRHEQLYLDAIMTGLQSPDYRRIAVPALAIYAVPGSAQALMEHWYDADDARLRQTVAELFALESPRRAEEIARFDAEVADSEVLVLENADHWIFLSHEQPVLDAIARFVRRVTPSAASAPPPPTTSR